MALEQIVVTKITTKSNRIIYCAGYHDNGVTLSLDKPRERADALFYELSDIEISRDYIGIEEKVYVVTELFNLPQPMKKEK